MRQDLVRLGMTLAVLAGVFIACTNDKPKNAIGPTTTPIPVSSTCATPAENCPCPTEGAVTACGNKVTGPSPNFIYCYEGLRTCENGKWGACGSGSIQTKSFTAGLSTQSLGGSNSCTGGTAQVIAICQDGKQKNQSCTSNADCNDGEEFCDGPGELTHHCRDDGDCAGDCQQWNGHCNGGAKANQGCNADADCPGSTCNMPGNGHNCINATGLCEGGSNDGNPCVDDSGCPGGGHCDIANKFGVCLGGKHNGKKCKNDDHCDDGSHGNFSCSNDIGDAGSPVDPCDPYCNVYSDSQGGFDAGPGFIIGDGGITLGSNCGDGVLAPGEACDDGNHTSGDGCSSTCTLETGFYCPTPGAACVATVCGNGAKEGAEACDDGNTTNGDGCSSTCTVEAGFYCPTPGSPCLTQTCGNHIKEGTEQCDDGNARPYDGCFNCQNEVVCPPVAGSAATCTATCGDGIKFPSEGCDDGNLIDGDGCDHTCTVEAGSVCTTQLSPLPASIDVPIIYHDFWPNLAQSPASVPTYGHPDFEHNPSGSTVPHTGWAGGACVHTPQGTSRHTGIMLTQLDVTDHEPRSNPSGPFANECNQTSVDMWYRDNATYNMPIIGRFLRLNKTGASQYVFSSSNNGSLTADTVTQAGINCGDGTHSCASTLTAGISPGFFPLQNQGFGNFYPESYTTAPPWSGAKVNFAFTSEVRLPFTYKGDGTEVFTFTGDDDVFVYIGGRLVVDLGGIGNAVSATYNLTSTSVDKSGTALGLVVGNSYELDVFQAERNTTGSNYQLTLGGFQRRVSVCTPPPPPQTLERDYVASCPPGSSATWQVFRWEAAAPAAPPSTIDFRAATADTQAGLPADKSDPSTVSVGQANATNSPAGGPTNWAYLQQTVAPFNPIPVDAQLIASGQASKNWLRVYMTFTGAPVLYQWQMLYDCTPNQ